MPATPQHVASVRLFVAAVCRLADLDEVTVDDAKLAVSELASAIVAGADRIVLVAGVGPGSVALTIGPWEAGLGDDDEFGPLEIAGALFESTAAEGDEVHILIEAAPDAD